MQIYFIDLSLRFCNVLIIGKENGKNITSVGSARGSTFVQRTSIGESKGYSVVSSDMNVRAHNMTLRQPDFNPVEHVTSFPHDDLEAMQEALRSKSGILQPSRSYIQCSPSMCTTKESRTPSPHVPIITGTYCSTTDMNHVFSFCSLLYGVLDITFCTLMHPEPSYVIHFVGSGLSLFQCFISKGASTKLYICGLSEKVC